ncbi:LysR family transcriptional regulator [Deinococcus hopiensis]|uniref:DNA-binding transcriptional regulator, LysR family n=1 Tax=Deinococcus hopiensis KR-140 TaxID=695939 RepID=A0A1W1VPM3_9DEIO|nr:LysR family transcriptional regulator [Deinococcus hopiensis]SMB94854.1 DNA-binding transcriptional regulator, LysR family [Deinococcus hopiensis KR-140]
MAPQTPTLAQLRALIAVAEAGGFGEAAAEGGVSQSSLSEAVAKLEALAGRPLLRRTPAGTAPTEAGQRVLEHARAAVQAAGDALLAAQEDSALSGTLRVASMRSTATHLLPPAIAAFRARHPGVRVEVLDLDAETYGGSADVVQSGRADMALIVAEEVPGLRLLPLPADEYLFVAPASRGAGPVQVSELLAPLILPPGQNACHLRVRRYLSTLGVPMGAVSEIEQDSVILSMVEYGLGITVMPRLALLPLPPGLVALPLPEPLVRPLSLAVLPHRAGLPMLRAFTEAVLRAARQGRLPPLERESRVGYSAGAN